MKKWLLFLACFTYAPLFAQSPVAVVYDNKNMAAEVKNTTARASADLNMLRQLKAIKKSKETALLNLTIVEQVQERIYHSLTTVDNTLKQSKQVIDAKNIVKDIIQYQIEVMEYAKNDPVLLLFAERQEKMFYSRGVDLIAFIQNFILAEKETLLMDVGKREKLIRQVIEELRVLRALAYTSKNQIYWARLDGAFRQLNPWQAYINKDKAKGEAILKNFKF